LGGAADGVAAGDFVEAVGVELAPVIKALAASAVICCHDNSPPTLTQMYRGGWPNPAAATQGPSALTGGMPLQLGKVWGLVTMAVTRGYWPSELPMVAVAWAEVCDVMGGDAW
jgi:hypothetical protein